MLLIVLLLVLFFSCFCVSWCFYTTKFEQTPGNFPGAPDCVFAGAFFGLLIVLLLVLFFSFAGASFCAPDCAFAGAFFCAPDCAFAGAFFCAPDCAFAGAFFCLGVWPGCVKRQTLNFLAFSTATAAAPAVSGPPEGSWESRAAKSALRRLCQPDHIQLQPMAKTLSWDDFNSPDAPCRGTRLKLLQASVTRHTSSFQTSTDNPTNISVLGGAWRLW